VTTVTLNGVDAATNAAVQKTFTVTVTDNELPVLTVPAADIPLNVIATTCAANYTIVDPISDNCTGTTWTYALSGATTAATSSAINDGTNATNVSFNRGVTMVTLNGVDAASNTAVQKTFTVTVTDNELPVLTVPAADISLNVIASTCAANYTIVDPIADNCPGSTWNYSLSGATTADTPSAINDGTNATNISFNRGVTTVTLNGVDAASNTAVQKTFTVTVTDNEVPVLTAPSNQQLNVIATTCAANFTIVDPIADNCTGATWGYTLSGATIATVTSIADGSNATNVSFNKGETTVTLSGVDASSNTAISTTFTVTVIDNQFPVAICPTTQPTVTLDNNGNGTLAANALVGNSTDNCTLIETSPLTNFVCSQIGTQYVGLFATDGSGNGSVAICPVSVVAPMIAPEVLRTWVGSASAAWSNPCNWSPISVPQALSPVFISNAGISPIVPNGSSYTIKSLEIQTGATLTIQNTGELIIQDN